MGSPFAQPPEGDLGKAQSFCSHISYTPDIPQSPSSDLESIKITKVLANLDLGSED